MKSPAEERQRLRELFSLEAMRRSTTSMFFTPPSTAHVARVAQELTEFVIAGTLPAIEPLPSPSPDRDPRFAAAKRRTKR